MRIKLGYEIPICEQVDIRLSHLIVTGITQLSGKTTTLEALIKRSGLKAIVFRTKVGEKSFTEGVETAPFFRDRSDYEFVKSLIEAYAREKLFLEKGTLMRLCKGTTSLLDIKRRVDYDLANKKLKGLQEEIHTRLQHYLEKLIPQIQYANFSSVLSLSTGINIMNLERFSIEAQSLIIQSVLDEVLKNHKDLIIVIPEAWKFIPQKYNNPCKRSVESFIRQGAANNNFIWIDSQDMAGVDKIPLKQISTWILGYQTERNEVKHTLDQISLPARLKPSEQQIMTLRKGQFFLSGYDGVRMVYVQPSWLGDEVAMQIAKGEISVDTVTAPPSADRTYPERTTFPLVGGAIRSNDKGVTRQDDSGTEGVADKLSRELTEISLDFFNRISSMQSQINLLNADVQSLKMAAPEPPDEETIIRKILLKLPVCQDGNSMTSKEALIQDIIARIPKAAGQVVYEVTPLVKIKKGFLLEAKERLLARISTLDDQQKKMLKFIEQRSIHSTKTLIFENCFGKSATGGSTYTALSAKITEMQNAELIRLDTAQRIYPNLRSRIKALIEQYGATEQEIDQIYNHILAEGLL